MKTYGQYCPVAQALELVGDRWSLLVVRELLCGSTRFGDILRGVPRMPRSMLARRLAQLERDGIVKRRPGKLGSDYTLTEAGEALEHVVVALGKWSRTFAHRDLREEELDAGLLMWNMQRGVNADRVPRGRVLLRFEFRSPAGMERYWLDIKDGTGELCLANPGVEESLVVHTTARVMTEIWLGHRDFRQAIAQGDLSVQGPRRLIETLPTWFLLNHFVQLERADQVAI